MKEDSEVVLYGESEIRVVTRGPQYIHQLRYDGCCINQGPGRSVVG